MARNFGFSAVLLKPMKRLSLVTPVGTGLLLFTLVGCSIAKPHEPPAAWRNVNGGMTQQEISQLLGPPSQPSAQGGDVWIQSGWELHVDYDQYGRARNILSRPIGSGN